MSSELLADQPLGEKLIKKGFWLYLFAYLIAPAGYFVKVLISNSVSVADIGVLYSIVSLMGLLNVYNDLGLTESLQYFLPRYRLKKQFNYIKTSIYLSFSAQVLTALVIVGLIRMSAPRLAEHYFHSPSAELILRYFCFYFLGINLFQSLQSIFVAFQDTFHSQLIEFARMRSIVGFTVFFFFTDKQTIEWYSLNWILGLAVGILIATLIFYSKYRKLLLQGEWVREKPMLKEYMKYALWSFLGLNIGNLFGGVIQQIVVVMIGPESAGYYTNFSTLFGISGVVIGPIMGLIFPIVSELVSKNDTHKLSSLFNFFYTYFSVLSLSLAVFFLVLGQETALIIFGAKFLLSGSLFSISALFIVLNSLLVFNLFVLAGMGKIKERVQVLGISTVLTIASCLILIPLVGLYGGVISFCVSQLSLFILSYAILHKHIVIKIDWAFILKNIVVIGVLGVLTAYIKPKIFVVDDLMRYENLWKFVVVGSIFYILFGLFNWKKLILFKDEVMKLRS